MTTIQTDMAPVIRFETRSKQDNTKSLEAGRPVFVDVDYLVISPPGTKDTFEAEATEWLGNKRRAAALGNYNLEWIDKFEAGYARWKSGQEMPETGWSLRMCPAFTPGEINAALAIDIKTVESLSQVPDTGLGMLGLNGRVIRDKARALMDNANDSAKVAVQMASMKADIATLTDSVIARDEKIAELEAALLKKKGT